MELLVVIAVIEHLQDTESFMEHSARALKPGGHMVHVFPSRYAPFALINLMLGPRLAQKVLYFFEPFNKDHCGFPAYYDKCYYAAMLAMLKRHGFEIVDVRVNYYQSKYYDFFVPFFLLSAAYEAVIRSLNARNLGASMLVVAKKV